MNIKRTKIVKKKNMFAVIGYEKSVFLWPQ